MRVANTTMQQQCGHSPARVEYAASGCHRGHNGSAEVTRGQASRHMASGSLTTRSGDRPHTCGGRSSASDGNGQHIANVVEAWIATCEAG